MRLFDIRLRNETTIPFLSKHRFLRAKERFKLAAGHAFSSLLNFRGKLPLPGQKRLFLISISNLGALVASQEDENMRTMRCGMLRVAT